MERENRLSMDYVRGLDGNYVRVIPGNDFLEYQVQMITRNRIRGLLGCVTERIDDQVCFLYEINSCRSLSDYFSANKMGREAFSQLMDCLKLAVENVGNYLLDVNGLVFDPDYVFVNTESGEVGLLYVPGAWNDVKQDFRELARLLLDWVDYKDEKAVLTVYELHRRTMEENYSFGDLFRATMSRELLFSGDSRELVEDAGQREEPIAEEREASGGCRSIRELDLELEPESTWSEEEPELDVGFVDEEPLEENRREKPGFFQKLTAPMRDAAGGWFKGKSSVWNNEDDDLWEDEPFPAGVAEETNYGASWGREPENRRGKARERRHQRGRIVPRDGCGGRAYELTIFPFLIGTLEEAVDGVIEDPSVSRIHAKIEKRGEEYFVADLNSEHGTYVNGHRVPQKERKNVENGDLLRFGRVEYCLEL